MAPVHAGQTIMWAGPSGKPHLWCVLTDPDPISAKVVMVHLVTARGHTDRTVVLQCGDHPFVRVETHVAYGSANLFTSSRLDEALRSGAASRDHNMSASLLQCVRAGLYVSSRTMHFLKEHCRTKFTDTGTDI